jgi:hypothetical protein
MDAISTALTAAWLDAVRRVQSAQPLTQTVGRDERTLTDVMEAALRHGGLDSKEQQWVDPTAPGQVLDKRV